MDKSFHIRYNGHKLKVRLMKDNEIINKKALQCFRREIMYPTPEQLKKVKWYPSRCVGDKVYEHPEYVYIVVLSKFYPGESTPTYQF